MLRYGLFAVLASCILATSAQAADPHRLAFSKRLGVDVYALPNDQGKWCNSELSLSIALDKDSPLLEKGIEGFVPKLAPVFAQECPAAEKAVIQAYKAENREPIGSTYSANKAGQWIPKVGLPAQDTASVLPPPPLPEPAPKPSKPLSTQAYDATEWNLLLGYAQTDNAFLTDEKTVKAYAAQFDCNAFSAASKNEFKIQDYLDRTKTKLQSLSAALKPYVRVSFDADLGKYDMAKGAFAFDPLSKKIGTNVSYVYCSGHYPLSVRDFVFSWKPGKGIYGLPLAKKKAEAYVEKIINDYRTRRAIHLEVIAKPTFSPVSAEGNVEIQLEILEARAFESSRNPKLLHIYSEDELREGGKTLEHARLEEAEHQRKLAAEREQEQLRREQLQQANYDYTHLSKYATRQEKIAYMNGDQKLVDVNWSIGASLAYDTRYLSTFLVKAGGNGRQNINATWPQRLSLNLSEKLPALKEGKWYVVTGRVKAQPHDDGAMPTALMNAEIVTECQEDMCGESQNVVAMIQHRYPDLNWHPTN